jgi:hypothetical protein
MRITKRFAVTRERYNDDSIVDGATTSNGYVRKRVTLREAIKLADDYGLPYTYSMDALSPDSWPTRRVRWLSNNTRCTGTDAIGRECFESRSIHMPADITDASSMRVARLLGAIL